MQRPSTKIHLYDMFCFPYTGSPGLPGGVGGTGPVGPPGGPGQPGKSKSFTTSSAFLGTASKVQCL